MCVRNMKRGAAMTLIATINELNKGCTGYCGGKYYNRYANRPDLMTAEAEAKRRQQQNIDTFVNMIKYRI